MGKDELTINGALTSLFIFWAQNLLGQENWGGVWFHTKNVRADAKKVTQVRQVLMNVIFVF